MPDPDVSGFPTNPGRDLAGSDSLLVRHDYLLRRLHSLSGIVPVGVFVIFHLFTNFQMVFGAEAFQHEVNFIHSIPALLFVEIFLWLSIAFHAGLGLVFTFKGSVSNVHRYRYMDNWRYTLQRITGLLALVFIFLHVATLRWRWELGGWFTPFYIAGPEGEPLAQATTAKALQAHWLVVVLYVTGVGSVVFHWSNGLWTSAITWGLTISQQAQRRWGLVCAGLGLALALFSAGAIVGAMRYDVSAAEQAAIDRMIQNQKADAPQSAPGH